MARDEHSVANLRDTDSRPPPWLWMVGVGGLAITAVWYGGLRIAHGGHHMLMAEHGDLGSSFGPVSALFALSAVLAALWSMELQRRELRAQSKRLDEHQRLLEEQRAQFTRSADAHEKLAQAQADTVEAQKRANFLTERLIESEQTSIRLAREAAKRSLEFERVERSATIARLRAAMASVRVATETARGGVAVYPEIRSVLEKEVAALGQQLEIERSIIDLLNSKIEHFQT
jgi:hypothetical protein